MFVVQAHASVGPRHREGEQVVWAYFTLRLRKTVYNLVKSTFDSTYFAVGIDGTARNQAQIMIVSPIKTF
jgi:hypothetical protein